MRSLADLSGARRARRALELTLRGALLLALAIAIARALTAGDEGASESASGGASGLRDALRDWSTTSAPRSVHLGFDSTPTRVVRDWVAALPGAATRISWESSLLPVAIAVEPIAGPKRASRVWVAAPSGSRVALADSLGAMDSIVVRTVGASAGPLLVEGAVRGTIAGSLAIAERPDSLVLRPVLVLGRAGWEGKFLAAALEEYGWQVDARLSVSPGNDVVRGASVAAIDSSHYSAVVVVDSSAARYGAAIERYVRQGGGLVAIGEGASLASLRAILPGAAGEELPSGEMATEHPRAALALRPLVQLKADAIPLEKRGNRVAIAARRAGRGRVVQVGYVDTWRWRMGGSGDPVEEFRSWWSSVISSAAYAPRVGMRSGAASDPAPLATLYTSLGSPTARGGGVVARDGKGFLLLLFIVAIFSLVVETASRRLDGKP